MTNLAQVARSKAQRIWPGAAVHSRGRSWIKHQHPTDPDKFIFDTHIGPIHYGPVEEQEIDTAWEPSANQPWLHQMVKADFNVFMGPGTTEFDAGQIVRYVHPDSGEDVTFEAQQLQWTNDLDQIEPIADPQPISHTFLDDDTIHWVGAYGSGLDFRWQAQTARLAKFLTIQQLSSIGSPSQFIIDGGNPVLKLGFIFQKSSAIDIYIDGFLWNEKSNNPQKTTADVEFRLSETGESLWWFKQASVADNSEDVDRPLIQQRFRAQANNLFVEVLVPWAWLLSAVYPVEIDPTVDYQVGASADDAYERNSTMYLTVTAACNDATNEYNGYRWSVTIPDGATIDTAWIDVCFVNSGNDEPNHTLDFEDGSNPGEFTTTSDDISGRAGTTATAMLSHTNLGAGDNSWLSDLVTMPFPEIKTIIQELVDSYDYSSGNAMVARLQGSSAPQRDYMARMYDYNTSLAAKLHIEYTTGGASYPMPEALQSYRQRRI